MGRRARLLHQTSAEFLLPGKVAVHQFYRHLPLQVQIGGAIDRAHPAIAQKRIETVAFVQGLTDKAGHCSLLTMRPTRGNCVPRQHEFQRAQE